MTTEERPPQTWRYCETHDVRFKSRSPASVVHVHGQANVVETGRYGKQVRRRCVVVDAP